MQLLHRQSRSVFGSNAAGQQRRQCCARSAVRRQPVAAAVHAQAAASGGFGKTNKKKVETGGGMVLPKKFKNITDADLSDDNASASKQLATADGPAGFPQGWTDLKLKADAFPLGKTAKPVELVGGRALMVYRYDGKVFVSDANSTAYQYPMTDARLFKDAETGRVAAEVPLDGTIYDLSTGAVLTWCPKDNPMRSLLGTLKSKAESTPLAVYPVHVTPDGSIFTKLA